MPGPRGPARALAVVLAVALALGGCNRRTAIAYGGVAVIATGIAIAVGSCPENSGFDEEVCARGVAATFAIGFGIAAVVAFLVGSAGRAPAEPAAEPSGAAAFHCARSATDAARGVCGRGVDACALQRLDANRAGDDLGPCEPARTVFCFDLTGDARPAESCHPTSSACAAVRTPRRAGECAARN